MFLAQNIKYLRTKAGLTQEEFSNILKDVGQRAVSNWEAGLSEPELSRIIKISEYFGVTLDDLVLRELKPPVPLYVSNIRHLRKRHGITQEQMGELLGLKNKSSLSLIEAGKSGISVENLEKLSDLFGVTLDEMVKQDLTKEQ